MAFLEPFFKFPSQEIAFICLVMIHRRKPCCLLLSPGAIKTWSCINIHLGPVLGGELSLSVQHNLKIKSCPSQDKEALDSNIIFIQMHSLPPALPACHEIGKKGHAAS